MPCSQCGRPTDPGASCQHCSPAPENAGANNIAALQLRPLNLLAAPSLPRYCSTLEEAREAVDQIARHHGFAPRREEQHAVEYVAARGGIILNVSLFMTNYYRSAECVALCATLRLADGMAGTPYSAGLPEGRQYRKHTMEFAQDISVMLHRLTDYLLDLRYSGYLRRWMAAKHYGFIAAHDGEDVFCHRSALPMSQWALLREGLPIRYQLAKTDRGWEAVNALLCTSGSSPALGSQGRSRFAGKVRVD